MEIVKVLFVSFLLVVWWIAAWGIVELIIQQFIQGSKRRAVMAYSSMILFVITVLYFNPGVLEHFV